MAIATEVAVYDHSMGQEPSICAPVADTNKVRSQFLQGRGSTVDVYPIAFSPRVCSFQSRSPPKCYLNCVKAIERRLRSENHGQNVLTFGEFQGYTTQKQGARNNAKNFHLGQSTLTGAHCLSASSSTVHHKRKKNKLMKSVDEREPWSQIIQGVDRAIENGRIRFRFEPIVTIDWQFLKRRNQTFEYVVEGTAAPMMNIFHDYCHAICEKLLALYPTKVKDLHLNVG
jgi:hypothetical protein